jgi:hypothetical protein
MNGENINVYGFTIGKFKEKLRPENLGADGRTIRVLRQASDEANGEVQRAGLNF